MNDLQGIIKLFTDWTKLKVRIHLYKSNSQIYFRERQIWWTSVGQNIGVESNGKNSNFERPIIILKKFNSETFLGITLSTKPRTGYYYQSVRTGTNKPSFANLSQLKLFSSKRLIRRIGDTDPADFKIIREKIKGYL